MTNEQTREQFLLAWNSNAYLNMCTSDDMKNVIDALDKQIPKCPDLEGDGYDDNGELIYDTGYCPNCRHEFEVYYDATKYCPNCGQHLDWSNIEDLDI